MKRIVIFVCAILLSLSAAGFFFWERNGWLNREAKYLQRLEVLKVQEEQLNKKISGLEARGANPDAEAQMKYYIRPHSGTGSINLEILPGSPVVYGPIGEISANNPEPVNVVEEKDGWARVKIEGWVPKWYLVENLQGTDEIKMLLGNKMYIKEECSLKMYPDDNATALSESLFRGKAVYTLKQYKDWFYIKLQQVYGIPAFTEGWVKASQIGLKDEVEPLEGYLKIGTRAFTVDDYSKIKNCPKENIEIVKDKRPVHIAKKQGDYALVESAGAWYGWVKLSDIEY